MTFSKPGLKYSVELSEEMDERSDLAYRHCRIEEFSDERLMRTFTGKVLRTQATRQKVKEQIERWCELFPDKLPGESGTVIIDLSPISK